MNNEAYYFPEISLLITHYNRTDSLSHLLTTFKAINCRFGEIVVSDDCSNDYHRSKLKVLQQEFSFNLVSTPQNKGLGNNINKGQDAVKTPYTLYIQEDFEPVSDFPIHLRDSLEFMEQRSDFDIVRFYSYLKYPYLTPFKKGFSEMKIPFLALNYTKIYFYSDHPHLRRSSFLQKFDRYPEGLKGDKTEYLMCLSFIKKQGKGLFYDNFQSLFHQINSEAEPSTMKRNSWTNSRNPVIKIVRDMYRQLKYNYDILFA